MYICLCNAVTERQIRSLAAEGVATLDELQSITGCGDTCGSCHEAATQTLRIAARESGSAQGQGRRLVDLLGPDPASSFSAG